MGYILPIIGIIGSFFMIKYREQIGGMMGEAQWMTKIGGVYNVVILVAIFIFFWSLASLTGTTDLLFRPILWFIPGLNRGTQTDFVQ